MVRSPVFSSTSRSELVSASRSSAADVMICCSSSSRSSVELRRPVISMIRLSAPTSSWVVSAIVSSPSLAGGRGCRLLGHEVLDEVGRDVAGAELRMVEDLQVEGDRRLDATALDLELLERADHPVD